MANIFENDISYITEAEVKTTTNKADLKTLADAEVKILISKAETVINNYLGFSFDIGEENEQVQQDIKIATFYTVEAQYENGTIDLIRPATSVGGEITSEKVGDRSVSYSEGSTSNNTLDILGLPTQAISILDKYKQIFFKQVL